MLLIQSPKVATYDEKPEMSAYEQTDRLLGELDKHDVVIQNLVNGDMVGHTGKLDAIIKAVEAVDECLGLIVNKVQGLGGTVLITADHGNCEEVCGKVATSHTTNPVNLIIVSEENYKLRKRGTLADIAPTMLKILGIEQPKEMDGRALF
jgi:2,3-bisphosphoglycerate-independent phosphoglycerate mutase